MVLNDTIRRGQLDSEILNNDLWPEAFEMLKNPDLYSDGFFSVY